MTGTSDADRIRSAIAASARTVESLAQSLDRIAAAARVIVGVLRAGGKVLTAGNGGSAAEAVHMSEELVGRFRGDRRSLPGLALCSDPAALTCIGNDYGFDEVFSRQLEGLGRRGDLLVVFSTSGRARNLRRAVETAARLGVRTLALLGRDGGPLAGACDEEIIVKGDATERIQEAHQVLVHLFLEAVDDAFVETASGGRAAHEDVDARDGSLL